MSEREPKDGSLIAPGVGGMAGGRIVDPLPERVPPAGQTDLPQDVPGEERGLEPAEGDGELANTASPEFDHSLRRHRAEESR